MSDIRIASRYAKSILGLANEKGVLESARADMALLLDTLNKNREFLLLLRNPVVNPGKKEAILKKIFQGKVSPLTVSLFEIMVRKHREGLLPEMAKEFVHQYNELKGIVVAKVVTTFPLTDDMREQFRNVVKSQAGKQQVILQEEVNKDLIGGFVLTIGDQQIDHSISSKLRDLKLKFSENPYVKEF